MIRIFFVLILFISNSFADIQIRKQNDLFCYDGDTCYVIYEGKKDKVRLLDLDTPEISNPKCEKEYILGIKALIPSIYSFSHLGFEISGVSRSSSLTLSFFPSYIT